MKLEDVVEVLAVPIACVALALLPITLLLYIWWLIYIDNKYANS